jgi:hypothetical protein
MSSDTTDIDRTALRKTIRQTLRDADDPPQRSDLVATVAVVRGAPEQAIADELDALERHGFVYCVGDDDPAVKLP